MKFVKTVLDKQLGGKENYVALAKVSPEKYQEINLKIIEYLVEENNTPGVYVTLNSPYKNIEADLKKLGVDTRLIIFIDAVTKRGGVIKKEKGCLYIGNPENLSDISIAIDQAVRALPSKKRFLFFDSLSTLLLYNNPQSVAKFIHFLSGRMRVWKVNGIIVSLRKKSDQELIDELMQFCDTQIDIGGEQ